MNRRSIELPDDGANYELLASYGIEDGSVDDLHPRDAFVLGVEWESVWSALNHSPSNSLELLVTRLSVARLTKLAQDLDWTASVINHTDPAWALMRFVRNR